MKVLMAVEGFGENRFGVEKVVENLAVYLDRHGHKPDVATMVLDGSVHDLLKKDIHLVKYWRWTGQIRFYPFQYAQLSKLISETSPDIIHCHGCMSWLHASVIKAAINASGLTIIVSAHGMLEPWLWRQKGKLYYWIKSLYWRLVMKPVLKRADFVHAITQQESETLCAEFPDTPQIRIPNAIDMNEYSKEQVDPDSDRYLLFMGRLHPKKGIDLLIEAFNNVDDDGVHLIIAGPDFDAAYTQRLKDMVESFGLSNRVSFIGVIHGKAKNELIQKAWCTVVPSYSDVVALVNLESAASFTPTITTTMTGLSDWEESGGVLVEPRLDPLTGAISSVCNWSLDQRMKAGEMSRRFVEERYSWDVIGPQWINAYRMIVSEGIQHD